MISISGIQEQAEELSRLKMEYAELHTEANRLEKRIANNKQTLEQYKMNNQAVTSDITLVFIIYFNLYILVLHIN